MELAAFRIRRSEAPAARDILAAHPVSFTEKKGWFSSLLIIKGKAPHLSEATSELQRWSYQNWLNRQRKKKSPLF
jgi:hypothetical protein